MNASSRAVAAKKMDHVQSFMDTKDWASSPIGPRAVWSPSFRTVLRLMLDSRYAMWMGWGPDLLFFCNDAYREQTLGERYRWAIGRPFREVWSEIWDVLSPRIEHVLSTGEATWDEGLLLFLERNGYPEETYHTFSYSPAPGDAPDVIGGLFCVVFEETNRVISERRIATLGKFASLLSKTQLSTEVFAAIEECLKDDARDISFSLTYLFSEEQSAHLVARTGFEGPHHAAPEFIDDDSIWPLSSIEGSQSARAIPLKRDAAWPVGSWQAPPSHAFLLPIARPGDTKPAGVFIAGMSPHRPLDDGARDFIGLFVGQLAAGLSNAFAYEETKKRAEALAEIDRAKTIFFSNVSHEFRTPLTLMLAPIEDMRASHSLDEHERARVELLYRNALRLLKLVNTLLEFSRIEAGRVNAAFEETDLSALTTDLASNFRSAMERAGLDFIVDCPPLGEAVFIDRTMWEKIVLNLLSNALKFTFEGTVSIRLKLLDDGVQLEVADTGIGIAEHDLPHLFERFHRIEGARSRSHEGSGIGLALVTELVQLEGGTIEVESTLGAGTAFRVRLPRGRAHLPDTRIQASHALQPTAVEAGVYVDEALRWIAKPGDAAPPTPSFPEARRKPLARLVVADDNADMLDYLTRILCDQWQVEAVRDGQEALEAINRQRPDLVLSDVMMPRVDGFGLVKAIKGSAELRSIPVVLLSARAGEEASAEALKAGADDYIVKPFSARDLLIRVTARLVSAQASEETLRQRRNLYRHFMQAPFPIAILRDQNHVVDLVNKACLKAWGRTESVEGLPLEEALPELQDQGFLRLLDEVYSTGVAHEATEVLARLANGPGGSLQDNYFSFVYAPLFDSEGKAEGIILCAFDVTTSVIARQTSEQATTAAALAMEKALRAAEQTNRAKDEFLATMSHELRTPLNAMLGWASLLKNDPGNRAKIERGLEVIERNARSQSRLVSDLLDVSRIISGKLGLTLKTTHLAAVVHAATEVVKPAADAKGVRLVVELDPALGSILADSDRLQQVLWNLLSNAVRFTPADGTIRVAAKRGNDAIVLCVEDSGSGIPTEHLPYVFDRFRQVDSSITRAHGGLGLGLAIVRHLVDAHGGTVSVRSGGAGAGATFTVTLPTRAAEAIPAATSPTDPAEAKGDGAAIARQLDGVRILIVDDEPDSLDLLRVVFEGAGALVSSFTSANEAMRCSEPLDIVLSDIGMPEIDGYAFLQLFKQREPYATVPAIALTAFARAEDRERALGAGYQEHVGKPFDPAALVEVVRRWVSAAKAS